MNATTATTANITTIVITITPAAPVSFIPTTNNTTLRIRNLR